MYKKLLVVSATAVILVISAVYLRPSKAATQMPLPSIPVTSNYETICSNPTYVHPNSWNTIASYCSTGKKVISVYSYHTGGIDNIFQLGCSPQNLTYEQPGMKCVWNNKSASSIQVTTCVVCAKF
ncbi:MAG: hypothetical protein WCJ58_00245 [bacterium]